MKIEIWRASDWARDKEIRENQTAEDILNLIKEFKESIIIDKGDSDVDYSITIYDDYIE